MTAGFLLWNHWRFISETPLLQTVLLGRDRNWLSRQKGMNTRLYSEPGSGFLNRSPWSCFGISTRLVKVAHSLEFRRNDNLCNELTLNVVYVFACCSV